MNRRKEMGMLKRIVREYNLEDATNLMILLGLVDTPREARAIYAEYGGQDDTERQDS